MENSEFHKHDNQQEKMGSMQSHKQVQTGNGDLDMLWPGCSSDRHIQCAETYQVMLS